jgi:uncharacterized membrane protein YjdF
VARLAGAMLIMATAREQQSVVDARPSGGRARWVTILLVAATTGQLVVATFATGLPQFEGKAFGSRLVFYPLLMTVPVLVWHVVARRRGSTDPLPWTAFAFLCAPFFIDTTGNTLDLYDAVVWWDDLNHFVNWLLLCLGIGLMLTRTSLRQRWALGLLVAGLGAILAVSWELAEWYTFIRHGTELDTAYTDTLGDEAFGTLGAAVAGVVVATRRGTRARWRSPRPLRPGR